MFNRNHLFIYIFFLVTSFFNFPKSEITINVWVHGTFPALKLLAHKYSPFRSWIYVPKGLSLAKELPYHYYFRRLAHECCAQDKQEYDIDHFYIYGWHSSTIRPGHRCFEGQALYKDLCYLIEQYKDKYDHIKIRLIGVSHGGNVVLHCVHSMPFPSNVITDVVLLGTPIQESSRSFVNNNCVRRVYSFYSNTDWMQRIDIQKIHKDAPRGVPFWSRRTFLDSDRVIQICLKINGSSISHGRYRSIAKFLPNMLQCVDDAIIKDRDQAHIVLDYKVI